MWQAEVRSTMGAGGAKSGGDISVLEKEGREGGEERKRKFFLLDLDFFLNIGSRWVGILYG